MLDLGAEMIDIDIRKSFNQGLPPQMFEHLEVHWVRLSQFMQFATFV